MKIRTVSNYVIKIDGETILKVRGEHRADLPVSPSPLKDLVENHNKKSPRSVSGSGG